MCDREKTSLLPKVSVITVSFNACEIIEKTILNVLDQSYSNLEYIIIDGCSHDGTVDVIKKYEYRLAYWKSEQDEGIYDAMNKGASAATGEWLCFMNCGDSFYNKDVIKEVIATISNDFSLPDVVYGKTCKIYQNYKQVVYPGNINSIKRHLPFCHQSSFVSREVFKKYYFSLQYKIVSDDHLFYNIYKAGYSFRFVDMIFANFEAAKGVSSQGYKRALLENYLIRGGKFLPYWYVRYYLPFLLRNSAHKFLIKYFHG